MGTIRYYVRELKNQKTGKAMFVGQNTTVQPVSLDQLCEEVSHATTVTKADVLAILTELEYVFVRMMRSNKSVKFGLLGTFRTSIKSKAVPSQELFSGDCIERINLRFQPSPTMKYLLKASNPELNFVQTEPNE